MFENEELSADVLLASAALPQVYQAVEIDGEHYWDGGYTGRNRREWASRVDSPLSEKTMVSICNCVDVANGGYWPPSSGEVNTGPIKDSLR